MKLDAGIVKRIVTISIGAPIVLMMLQNPVTLTLLVWGANYGSMIEWTAMKRHLKVALLDSDRSSPFAPEEQDYEFRQPVAKTNLFIICKVLAGSLICPLTWFGSAFFHCGMTAYYFFWVVFTLMAKNKAETKVSQFLQKLSPPPTTPKSRNLAERFSLHEMDVIAKRTQTDLMLSFALEYFGFVWNSGLCYALLLNHLHPTRGPAFTVSLLMGNWANDAAALIVGRSLKGYTHPLYPRISPNKSTEGAVAGIVSNAFTVAACMHYFSSDDWPLPTFYLFLIIGFVMGALGVVGDLLQSLLKRTAHIKDTGAIIPGHGGLLDRIDGLLVVFPLGYWIMWWILELEGTLWTEVFFN